MRGSAAGIVECEQSPMRLPGGFPVAHMCWEAKSGSSSEATHPRSASIATTASHWIRGTAGARRRVKVVGTRLGGCRRRRNRRGHPHRGCASFLVGGVGRGEDGPVVTDTVGVVGKIPNFPDDAGGDRHIVVALGGVVFDICRVYIEVAAVRGVVSKQPDRDEVL